MWVHNISNVGDDELITMFWADQLLDPMNRTSIPNGRGGPMKVMTIVGTRPEIIRLSRVITRLDRTVDHVLVHTGQNYDHSLNQVFFDDLGLRAPDHYLDVDTSSLGAVLGGTLVGAERVLAAERPDAVLVLGDTNSCIAALMAKRMRIPVYHMEAGNRCFDENVPEETNRRLVDHVADFNLAYTEHARRNLLAEGLHPRRVLVTGSPMREVLDHYRDQIDGSDVLDRLGLAAGPLLPGLCPPRGERGCPGPTLRSSYCLSAGQGSLGSAGDHLHPSADPQATGSTSRDRSAIPVSSGWTRSVSTTTTSCNSRPHAYCRIPAPSPKSRPSWISRRSPCGTRSSGLRRSTLAPS